MKLNYAQRTATLYLIMDLINKNSASKWVTISPCGLVMNALLEEIINEYVIHIQFLHNQDNIGNCHGFLIAKATCVLLKK